MMLLIVEVLLGLCVLGLLVVYAVWGYREKKRQWEAIQQRIDAFNDEIEAAYRDES